MSSSVFLILALQCLLLQYTSAGIPKLTEAGSTLSFQYIANTGSFEYSAYSGPYNQYMSVSGLKLSNYTHLTVELWATWKGTEFDTVPDYNLPGAAFFYGNSTNYFGIFPSNGTFLDIYDTQPYTTVGVGGSFSSKIDISNYYNEGRWCHISFSMRPSGEGTSHHTIHCPGNEILSSPWALEKTVTSTTLAGVFPSVGGDTFYVGSGPSPAVTDLYGSVDELRIWGQYKSPAEIQALRYTSLIGDEASLLSYHKFDENAGQAVGVTYPSAYDSSIYHRPSTFTATPPLYSLVSKLISQTIYNPLTTYMKRVAHDGTQTTRFLYAYDTTQTGSLGKVDSSSAQSKYYIGNTEITSDTFTLPDETSVGASFNISIVPSRAACNTQQTFTFHTLFTDTTTTNSVTVNLTVLGVTPVFTGVGTVNTVGGNVVFTGTGFGKDGNFDASESILITKTDASIVSCSNATVSNGGTTITCSVPAGTGKGNLGFSICTQTGSFNSLFAYNPPVMTYASAEDETSVQILGSNFGPNRTFGAGDSVTLNGTACTVTSINHNTILCTMPVNLTDSSYIINLTIGGQNTSLLFNYTLCSVQCVHGVCIGKDLCECDKAFSGPGCAVPNQCVPPCQNNGICVLNPSSNRTACDCSSVSGYTGEYCDESSEAGKKTPVAVIAGASAGAGVVIIALVIVVIVLAVRKKPQRGTSNFIPLEKKDFTKIIYGEQLTQSPDKHAGNLKGLEELLINDDLSLAFTISNITQITEADKIAKAMVVIFQENDKVLPLLQAFVNEEVRTSEQAGTLFRSNSMVSKMFKFYSRLIGLPYLYITIGPEMDELIAEELGLEVDPEKMEEGTDLDEMRWTLMAQSQKILKTILNSVEDCPAQFRQLFAHIKTSVAERFPDNVNTTIGGFIFLRFFCPAVSSPEAYGIVEEPPSASARRLLILITKVLQNLSNDVEFGSKEPYMTKMNDFIQSNRLKLSQFYEKLIKPSTKMPVSIDMPKNIKAVSLVVLANHIRENLNKIENSEMRKKLQELVESS